MDAAEIHARLITVAIQCSNDRLVGL